MVTETIAAIAVGGALTGAALNSVRAWYDAPEEETFSKKKFVGGLVVGGLAALGIVNFGEIATTSANGIVALFVTMALAGAFAASAVSKLHK